MKICIVTTSQPAANPRLVKEADSLSDTGHEVIVLYCYVADWAQEADKEILQHAKWNFKQIGGTSKKAFAYQWTRIMFAIAKKINLIFGETFFAERAHARCYCALLTKAINLKADLYIGHNPGSMAIALKAAKKNKAKAGFDFEDYHRGEYINSQNIACKRQIYLENLYTNHFNYLSAASPKIKEQIVSDFPALNMPFITLLNCFSLKNQLEFKTDLKKGKLKLCWFSQNIGRDRGLESIIQALREINDLDIDLTLIGNYTKDDEDYFKSLSGNFSTNLIFKGAISPANLFNILPHFDIGLALEMDKPLNRDICLTNKIFSFLLAGNAIILTETLMQKEFNEEYHFGLSFPINNIEKLKSCILSFSTREKLLRQRKHNYDLAYNTLNWENEFQKLLLLLR